jgi:hypothetical protein
MPQRDIGGTHGVSCLKRLTGGLAGIGRRIQFF